MAALLPPNKFTEVFALPKTDPPKLFDGDVGAAPPKIDAVLVVLLAELPPNILCAGFASPVSLEAADPKMLPVEAGGLATVDAGADKRPKLENDIDASDDLAPKTFCGCCCCCPDVSWVLAPKTLVVLVVGTELALNL